jgi:hypothetical protein
MVRKKNDGRRPGGRSGNTENDLPRVGYGRPPVETRFKRGQSGNPNGRARRVPTLHAALEKVLAERIELREGERLQRVSKLDALVRTTMNRALKGDPRYLRAILQLVAAGSGVDQGDGEAGDVISANDEAILADYLARLGTEVPTSVPKVDKSTREPPEPSEASKPNRGKP